MGLLLTLVAFVVGILIAIVPIDPPGEPGWTARPANLSRLIGLAVIAEVAGYVLEALAKWLEASHPVVAQAIRLVKTAAYVVEWSLRAVAVYGVGGLLGAWLRPRIGRK